MHRNFALDVLKLLLACMVVGIHADFLLEYSPLLSHGLVNGLFRTAVPLFLLINGYYFAAALQKGRTRNWFLGMLRYYAIWMGVYAWFWLGQADPSLRGAGKVLFVLVMGWYHLWYLPATLGAAALVVLLGNRSSRLLVTLSVLLFAGGVTLQYLSLFPPTDWPVAEGLVGKHWVFRNFLLFAYPFFCLGYLIRRAGWDQCAPPILCAAGVAVGAGLLAWESYTIYRINSGPLDTDLLASLLWLCPFLFLLFLKAPWQSNYDRLTIYSTNLYFAHILVLFALQPWLKEAGTTLTFVVILVTLLGIELTLQLQRRRFALFCLS